MSYMDADRHVIMMEVIVLFLAFFTTFAVISYFYIKHGQYVEYKQCIDTLNPSWNITPSLCEQFKPKADIWIFGRHL